MSLFKVTVKYNHCPQNPREVTFPLALMTFSPWTIICNLSQCVSQIKSTGKGRLYCRNSDNKGEESHIFTIII